MLLKDSNVDSLYKGFDAIIFVSKEGHYKVVELLLKFKKPNSEVEMNGAIV